jgi:hypothetical protein
MARRPFGDLVITNAGNNTGDGFSATGLASVNQVAGHPPGPVYAITFQQDAPSVTNAGAVFTPCGRREDRRCQS